ncbi:MAG TPA: formylglycine-generating enzyme family protein [Saprospiraceae bacterium]|nr:formylglycine-generating enzyme family protein [Saprospiraceae bacterium]
MKYFLVSILILSIQYSFGQSQQLEKSIVPELIKVVGGTMELGCTKEQKTFCSDDEKPSHEVNISTFFIGKFEITNVEFCHFLNDVIDSLVLSYPIANNKDVTIPPRAAWYNSNVKIINNFLLDYEYSIQFPKQNGIDNVFKPYSGYEKHPVIEISYLAALKYTEWLSQKTGDHYRLPTEAEWEYAARGGEFSKCHVDSCYIYSGSNNEFEVVAMGQTKKVGSLRPNELGIYDMSGNVYEWVLDVYDENYYKTIHQKSTDPIRLYDGVEFIGYNIKYKNDIPKENRQKFEFNNDDPVFESPYYDKKEKELERVVKGGCYINDPVSWRTSHRSFNVYPEHTTGFRIVKI